MTDGLKGCSNVDSTLAALRIFHPFSGPEALVIALGVLAAVFLGCWLWTWWEFR